MTLKASGKGYTQKGISFLENALKNRQLKFIGMRPSTMTK